MNNKCIILLNCKCQCIKKKYINIQVQVTFWHQPTNNIYNPGWSIPIPGSGVSSSEYIYIYGNTIEITAILRAGATQLHRKCAKNVFWISKAIWHSSNKITQKVSAGRVTHEVIQIKHRLPCVGKTDVKQALRKPTEQIPRSGIKNFLYLFLCQRRYTVWLWLKL